MDKKYGVVRLDKLKSAYGGHIHSVVYESDILENGMIGVLGDFLKDERELRKLVAPSGTTEPVVLIAHSEINYKEDRITDSALENFYIPVGEPARAYDLNERDIVSVSKQMVKALDDKAGVKKGAFVTTAKDSLLMTEVASPTGSEAFLGKVVDLETIGTATVVGQAGVISRAIDFIVVEIVKNRA